MAEKINNTPLRTIELLTGNENIPLGDKTHIKTLAIKNALQTTDVSVAGNTLILGNLYYTPTDMLPSDVTEETVRNWGFTKNTGTYIKPDGGIPVEDLDSSILVSLELADSALQLYDVSINDNELIIGDIVYTPGISPSDIVTEATVTSWGFTKNTGNYTRPSTGIPATDMTSAVQANLTKAGTALQASDVTVSGNSLKIGTKTFTPVGNVNETTVTNWGFTKNTGTVSTIKMNGAELTETDGTVDLGAVLTSSTTSLVTVTDMINRFNELITDTELTEAQLVTCIRKDTYNDDNWNALGGELSDDDYSKYKASNHNFQNIDSILLNSGEVLDCHHFFAVIDAGTNAGSSLIDMVSWLGDCITYAKDIKDGAVIKFPSGTCPSEDLLADMDAYNICILNTVGTIFNRIRTYFLTNNYINREKVFTMSKTSNPADKYAVDKSNIIVNAAIDALIKSTFGETEISDETYEYIDKAIQLFQDYIDMHYDADSLYRFLTKKVTIYSTKYPVTIDSGIINGTASASVSEALESTEVSLTSEPEYGYMFNSWNVYKTSDETQTIDVSNNKFKMPLCGVTVSADFVVDNTIVTKITLNNTEKTMKVGDKFILTAALTPQNASNGSVTWSTSNETVASVDDSGEITAVSEGDAVITCQSVCTPTTTESCNVTVESAE